MSSEILYNTAVILLFVVFVVFVVCCWLWILLQKGNVGMNESTNVF